MPALPRVAIVEDQTIFRELLAEMLAADGGVEVVAQLAEGRSVLEVCRERAVDMVILDAVLPDVSGLDVLKRLLQWRERLKVLVVTAHARPALVHRATELGARGCVSKETPLDELRLGIRHVLAGGTFYCSTTSALLAEAVKSDGRREQLTPRQRQVVQYVAQGWSSREIAGLLGISVRTVENHRLQIRESLGVNDVAGLTRYAIEQGLIEPKV